jgi:2,5-diketo-D-gluconate reductase A
MECTMTDRPAAVTTSFLLAPGVEMPAVGFGTYLIEPTETASAVTAALEAGYRHVDTAEAYDNESGVGQALRSVDDLDRDDVFVTTKLWPGNAAWGSQEKGHDQTVSSLEASLRRLDLEWVDLYLIHAPLARSVRVEQWQALVALRERGLARAIGVSNFSRAHLEELRAAGLPTPDANQIELHPWSQKRELVSYLRDNDILPIAYSSLAPLATWRHAAGHDSAKSDDLVAAARREDSPFRRIADKHEVTEAQVLLRWGVQQGYPVLPKTTDPERLAQNADLFGFALDDEDLALMAAEDRGDGLAWAIGDPLHAE